jgi:hypothetical protein
MNKRLLLKSQKNEILGILTGLNLDPWSFNWVEIPSEIDPEKTVSRLVRINTDFFYTFEMNGEAHYAIFSPAKESYIGTSYPVTWAEQCRSFKNWLKVLEKEACEPDLWKRSNPVEPEEKSTKQQTYITIPSSQSPDHQKFSSHLDRLLEMAERSTESGIRPKAPLIQIKRYYGKA